MQFAFDFNVNTPEVVGVLSTYPKKHFMFVEPVVFPTYLLVVREKVDTVKPDLVWVSGRCVSRSFLTPAQRAMPVYQVFSLSDDMSVSSYHTLDCDLQFMVDVWNRESESHVYNPEFIPNVKLTVGDIRFLVQEDMHGHMWKLNGNTFLSYWRRGFKTISELNVRVEALRPKYDVKKWKSYAKQHAEGDVSIVRSKGCFSVVKAGVQLDFEADAILTATELKYRLKVEDIQDSDIYLANIEAYGAIGFEAGETSYRLGGVQLDKAAVLSVLQLDGKRVKLPEGVQFEKETFSLMKQIFEKATGRFKDCYFEFDSEVEAREMFERLLAGDDINVKKSLQYYPTTEEAAAEFLAGVDLSGKVVFEPNGGEGFLVRKAYALGASHVKSAEIYTKFHPALRDAGAEIIGEDLLSVTADDIADVDAVLMNPPFTGGLDVKHVMHVLDIIQGRVDVYAIMSAAVKHSPHKCYVQFREYLNSIGVEPTEIMAGAFKDSGTNVSTVHVRIPAKARQMLVAA